jgi:hypothetical protein
VRKQPRDEDDEPAGSSGALVVLTAERVRAMRVMRAMSCVRSALLERGLDTSGLKAALEGGAGDNINSSYVTHACTEERGSVKFTRLVSALFLRPSVPPNSSHCPCVYSMAR